MKTLQETIEALKILHPFIGPAQKHVTGDLAHFGEEREYFRGKLCALATLVQSMPKTYEQDGAGEQAVIHLHYFTSGCDWYITEKDAETPEEPGQHQAFGLADLGYGPELGYISIVELLAAGAELDLYWQPKTIAKLNSEKEAVANCPSYAGPAPEGVNYSDWLAFHNID